MKTFLFRSRYNNPDYLDERHRHRYEVNLDVVISKFKVQMSDNSNDADSDSYLLDDNFRYIYKQIIKFQFSFNTMSKEWIVDLTTLTSAFRVTLGSSIAGTSEETKEYVSKQETDINKESLVFPGKPKASSRTLPVTNWIGKVKFTTIKLIIWLPISHTSCICDSVLHLVAASPRATPNPTISWGLWI
ncbi:hypothetical protein Tco_0223912 [Tanacetum coccineum]